MVRMVVICILKYGFEQRERVCLKEYKSERLSEWNYYIA